MINKKSDFECIFYFFTFVITYICKYIYYDEAFLIDGLKKPLEKQILFFNKHIRFIYRYGPFCYNSIMDQL